MPTPKNVRNKELELKVSNVFNQGVVGQQNFYTLARAKSDIYSAIKNDEDFVMGFPEGGVMHAFVNSSNEVEYSLYEGSEEWKSNTVMDGGVSAIDIDKGVNFGDIEELITLGAKALNYMEPKKLDAEGLAKAVVQKGISYSSYNSDLYLPDIKAVQDLLSQMEHPNNVTSFRSQIDNSPQLEIPFAYDKGMFHKVETDLLIPSLVSGGELDVDENVTVGRSL